MVDENVDPPRDGEVIGPDGPQIANPTDGDNYIALIAQYTERPDLLISTLERHDPGFIKRMNDKSEQRSEAMSDARFRFGGIQAYSGLAVSVCAAISLLAMLAYAVISESADFWLIMGIAVFYAITQGGPSGFVELCKGVAGFFTKDGSNPD